MMSSIAQLALFDGVAELFRAMDAANPRIHTSVLLLGIFGPLAFALALAISGRLEDRAVQIAGFIGFLIPALSGLWLWIAYLSLGVEGGYAFLINASTGLDFLGVSLFLGLNGISLPLYVMSGIVGLAAGIYAIQSGVERLRLYIILHLIMLGGLMGLFASIDLFFFFFFHEFALIPTFLLIAIWGRQGRRTVALELTIYLTLGAMLTLAGLIALAVLSGAGSFNLIALRVALMETGWQNAVYGLLLIGMGILVSLFPFHSWAPRGYATAPAPTAMLHAGVLKKFGLYGLIQIAVPLLPEGAMAWNPLLLWLALGNILIIGLITLAQRDLKLMLGNASVMHMGYAFLGIFAFSAAGMGGAVLMMVAHGLSVALLFLLADSIETRCGTTDMRDLGGLGSQAPVLMAFFVAAIMASIGLPGFANFWGELTIFTSLWASASPWVIVPAISGIVISAVYGLRAVARIFFGEPTKEFRAGDLRGAEKAAALVLLISLFFVGFWPRSMSDSIDAAVADAFPPTATFAPVAAFDE